MGWEWRCFVPMTEDTPDLLPALDANATFANDDELRADIYLPLTAELGLKKRGGSKIELKQRLSRDEHGCEYWTKSVGTSVKSVLGSLPSHLQYSQVSSENKQCVTLEKSRKRAHVSTGDASSINFEQTDIQVEIDGRHAGRWRSFCIEASDATTENGGAAALVQFIASMPKLKSLSRNELKSCQAGMIGGYPEFVASMLIDELLPQAKKMKTLTLKLINEGDVRAEPSGHASILGVREGSGKLTASEFHTSSSDDSIPSPELDMAKAMDSGQELWMVRHGERIDETKASRGWRLKTHPARLFDPPLTDQGAEQARTAAAGLKALGAPEFSVIYSSPCMRTLSTAHELANELGVKEVRTVHGLAYCAAAVRDAGPRYRNKLSFLPLSKMQALCPELTGDETSAPDISFENACAWLCSGGASTGQTSGAGTTKAGAEEVAADKAGTASKARKATGPVLVVTHREGIRDLLGKHLRLPYCAIARFGVSPATADSPREGGAASNGKEQEGTSKGGVQAAGLRFQAEGLYTSTAEAIEF